MGESNLNEGGEVLPRTVIDAEVCKGCRRCIAACPRQVLRLRPVMNHAGIQPAEYGGRDCTGCGICFYNCPEPYAIRVEAPDRSKRKV
jgi:NAD-dependent dihydropyrimidine dehydrogenase PreA subunit